MLTSVSFFLGPYSSEEVAPALRVSGDVKGSHRLWERHGALGVAGASPFHGQTPELTVLSQT